MWMQEKLFDLPVSFIADYVSEQMKKEVSLRNEALNAERAGRDIQSDSSLRDRVTVPTVYWDWTGESVMTADFINAFKLTDKEGLDKHHLSYRATMDAANAVFAAQTFKFGFVHCDPHPGAFLLSIPVRTAADPSRHRQHPRSTASRPPFKTTSRTHRSWSVHRARGAFPSAILVRCPSLRSSALANLSAQPSLALTLRRRHLHHREYR